MKVLLTVWAIGFAITLPVVLSLCKAAQRADKLNKLVHKGRKEC